MEEGNYNTKNKFVYSIYKVEGSTALSFLHIIIRCSKPIQSSSEDSLIIGWRHDTLLQFKKYFQSI